MDGGTDNARETAGIPPANADEQPQKKVWYCKIGEAHLYIDGADAPMREAVSREYERLTGVKADFIFSGWGAELEERERAVVENREPVGLSRESALAALNALRSNIVATQSASWSNTMYPLVAILNAAGIEMFDSTDQQMREHMDCYGGAGGYPGNLKREAAADGWCEPVGAAKNLARAVRRYLDDPSDAAIRRHLIEATERVEK